MSIVKFNTAPSSVPAVAGKGNSGTIIAWILGIAVVGFVVIKYVVPAVKKHLNKNNENDTTKQ